MAEKTSWRTLGKAFWLCTTSPGRQGMRQVRSFGTPSTRARQRWQVPARQNGPRARW